ncbi:MAG: hypothetical protein GKR89_10775 [Candidatus Latescibacteria bacterium]|nr:hypothetical protein [Candidatus Latescibacterota bacterium]
MKLLDKILLPTDFSPASQDAVQTGVLLARTFNAEIDLLYILEEDWVHAHSLEKMQEIYGQRLQQLRQDLEGRGIRVGETVVETGTPFERIIERADERDVNLILMGAKGHTQDDAHPLGTTATRVMRKALKPVWAVQREAAAQIGGIVCAVDFSAPSHRALENAVHLARDLEAELTVLHVLQAAGSAPEQEAYRAEQTAQFDRFLDDVDFYNVQWKREIRRGNAAPEILAFLKENPADLLIMGSIGRTGLARVLMGSVAEKVVREMPCSVVTLKAEDAIRLQLEEQVANVENRYRQGRELLQEGYPQEARRCFDYCIVQDMMFAPAWEGLAEAHQRLGHEQRAEECRQQARFIHDKNWQRKVEAEIRGELWGEKVGKQESKP